VVAVESIVVVVVVMMTPAAVVGVRVMGGRIPVRILMRKVGPGVLVIIGTMLAVVSTLKRVLSMVVAGTVVVVVAVAGVELVRMSADGRTGSSERPVEPDVAILPLLVIIISCHSGGGSMCVYGVRCSGGGG